MCFSFSNKLFAGNNSDKTFAVRALYLSDNAVVDSLTVKHFISLAKKSSVNTYVINIKGTDGLVNYESKIEPVRKAKAYTPQFNISNVIKQFHKNHIHVIGRVVCFNDTYLAQQKPEWAIKNAKGEMYITTGGEFWVNPMNKEVWKYLIDIAKEGLAKGFDEIQFDYVRFPTDGNVKELDYGNNPPEKFVVIDNFLAYARAQMPKAILSADVFGIICESPDDMQNIGQNMEYVGRNLNYISPMTYPSLYAKGQIVNDIAFAKPDLEPYAVVYNSLLRANNRIAKVKAYRAKIRPYLQAYTASWLSKEDYQPYGTEQIKQQIKATHDAGCSQWIFWNDESIYPEDAF